MSYSTKLYKPEWVWDHGEDAENRFEADTHRLRSPLPNNAWGDECLHMAFIEKDGFAECYLWSLKDANWIEQPELNHLPLDEKKVVLLMLARMQAEG